MNVITGFAFVVVMLMSGTAFSADAPTLHQVYEAANAGRMSEAQGMMQQVLKEHPNSAKAHYVDAEILAKAGHLAQAREELSTAERLEPGLAFAKPKAVQELKARVSSARMDRTSAPAPQAERGSGFPWGLLLLGSGLIVLLAFLVRALASRGAAPTNYPVAYPSGTSSNGGQPYPGGGYAPPAPSAPGMGSGIMSGLATGAALGAGMVAGEALAHHFIDGNHADAAVPPPVTPIAPAENAQPDDMGGTDFGIADNSSWDDDSSVADISGGDDWS